MSIDRSFTKVIRVLILVALPFVATPALARHDGERRARAAHGDDEAQMRDLLSKLAAASGVPEPEERTDADLMYEAMLRWNGEPPDSAVIDRAIANSKTAAAKSKRATQDMVRHMFWKDPFADDPHRLIPVRQEDRDLLDTYARKQRREAREARESREPRDEMSRLRAQLADAREENQRLRDRADMTAERQACVADGASTYEVRKHRPGGGSHVHSRHTDHKHAEIVLASTVQSYQPPPEPVAPPAPPPPIPAHGIIVVPLPSPPSAPPVESGRRSHASRDRGSR